MRISALAIIDNSFIVELFQDNDIQNNSEDKSASFALVLHNKLKVDFFLSKIWLHVSLNIFSTLKILILNI